MYHIFVRILDLDGKFIEIIEDFVKMKELKYIKNHTNVV